MELKEELEMTQNRETKERKKKQFSKILLFPFHISS